MLSKNYLLITILIIAAILRFIAVKPGYNQYHNDETAIWGSAIRMVKNSTLDPGRYDYPATTMVINTLLFKSIFIPISWGKYYLTNFGKILDGVVKIPPTTAEAKRVFSVYIAGERDVSSLFWTRSVTAFFGLGTVLLTYQLGRKVFSKKIGLLAALFLAFNYRNVVNSHLALPDIYNAFFFLAAAIAAWNLWQRPSRLTYLLAGLSAGFAFSIKYQIFSALPLIFVHLLLSFQGVLSLKKLFDGRMLMAGLFILLIFFLTNPYFFLNLETVVTKMNEEFIKYGMGTNELNLYPISYLYHIDYGPPQFALVVLGLLAGLVKKPLQSLFLLVGVVPAYWVFIYYSHGGFYVRNFITTTPILLIFAAMAFFTVFNLLAKKLVNPARLLILTLVLVPILYVPARNSILSSYGYTKTWNYAILRSWLKENLPPDVTVGVHVTDKSILEIKNRTTEFSPTGAFALAEHVENEDSFVVVNLNWAASTFYSWMNYGFADADKFWNKPVGLLQNTFHGVAAEELFRYQIKTVTKPWQAPGNPFVVAKVPQWPQVEMSQIKNFSFDNDLEGWRIYGTWKDDERRWYENDSGSLAFLPGSTRLPTIRATSPAIPIKAEHLYWVSAFLRTDKVLVANKREGFIRIDFYNEDPNLEERGLTAAVSSRVYGTDDWVEKKVVDRAPVGAKYLTVSFQTSDTNVDIHKIWLDNVTVRESVEIVDDLTANPPYTHEVVDLNYLYPNSHGNL